MSMDYIRKTYRLDVKRGDRVIYRGRGMDEPGTVIGSHGALLRIRLDDSARTGHFHPTWELELLPRAARSPTEQQPKDKP